MKISLQAKPWLSLKVEMVISSSQAQMASSGPPHLAQEKKFAQGFK
jgi:hypothetical protein